MNKSNIENPKIAIVCDWITRNGGAVKVVHELHKLYPNAPIFTSTYEQEADVMFKKADVRTAWFQKLPKPLRRHQLLTIPRQLHFGRLKLHDYDVVISAGSSESKAVRAPDGVHIDICYTPTLQYWIKPENYLQGGTDSLNFVWRYGLKILMPYVKRWDFKAAQRPDKIYAISNAVKDRIATHYQRRADGIIYPPCDISRFTTQQNITRSGFITWGRHVQHKRLDLAIKACNEIGAKLLVIGDGPENARLQAMAGPTITFKKHVSDEDMVRYVATSEAFIFPNEEDFGIVAVEAQAAGTPVIAYRAGGALDTVIGGITGELFDKPTIESLAEALRTFNPRMYNRQAITDNAAKFSNETFRNNIQKIVQEL